MRGSCPLRSLYKSEVIGNDFWVGWLLVTLFIPERKAH